MVPVFVHGGFVHGVFVHGGRHRGGAAARGEEKGR
jgi:hypothetical protein